MDTMKTNGLLARLNNILPAVFSQNSLPTQQQSISDINDKELQTLIIQSEDAIEKSAGILQEFMGKGRVPYEGGANIVSALDFINDISDEQHAWLKRITISHLNDDLNIPEEYVDAVHDAIHQEVQKSVAQNYVNLYKKMESEYSTEKLSTEVDSQNLLLISPE